MSLDLFNALQAQLAGNRLGDSATQGMVPTGSQSRGSPQAWINAISLVRSEIYNMGKIMDALQSGGSEMDEVRAYMHKHVISGLNETLLKLKDKLQEIQQGSMAA